LGVSGSVFVVNRKQVHIFFNFISPWLICYIVYDILQSNAYTESDLRC
jgi:hypothetical protein